MRVCSPHPRGSRINLSKFSKAFPSKSPITVAKTSVDPSMTPSGKSQVKSVLEGSSSMIKTELVMTLSIPSEITRIGREIPSPAKGPLAVISTLKIPMKMNLRAN